MTQPFHVLWSLGTHCVVAVLHLPLVQVPGVAVHVAAVHVAAVQFPAVQMPPCCEHWLLDEYCDFEHLPALWQLFLLLKPATEHVPALVQLLWLL